MQKQLIKFAGPVLMCLVLGLSFNVSAQDLMRIVAIINDDIISFYDVKERMKLVNLTNNIPNDQQSQKRLADRVLRTLIDEHMKLQEAKKQNVRVSDRDIQKQLNEIAKNNNMTPEKFEQFLRSKNINISSMKQQINSQIAWTKTLAKTVRRKIYITDDEIDEEIARLEATNSNIQKRVFDIFIAADGSQSDVEARRLVNDIIQQLSVGANFSALARNYSQSSNASVGGDMGWISPGQLPEDLDAALNKLKPGQAPAVIESVSGFHIVKVSDERSITGNLDDTKFDLSQVIIPLDKSLSESNRADIGNYLLEIARENPVCGMTEDKLTAIDGAKLAAPKGMRLGDLSPAIKEALTPLNEGQMIKPLILGDTMVHITVCKRYEPTSNLPSRRDIGNNMGQQRMELLARQYLRDIRNAAYIDVRM